MATSDFTLTLTSRQTPTEVFNAVANVRNWWTGYYAEEITGNTDKIGNEFTFVAGGGVHRSTQQLVEVLPRKKIVWLVTESKLSFLEDAEEWTGTKIIFDITEENGQTKLVFTHEGLKPQNECYQACAPAWTQYLQNKLLPLINR